MIFSWCSVFSSCAPFLLHRFSLPPFLWTLHNRCKDTQEMFLDRETWFMGQRFKLDSISPSVFLQRNCEATKNGGKGGDVLRAGVIKAWKVLFSTLSTLSVFFAPVHSPSWNKPLAQTNEMATDYVCFTNYSQGKESLRSYQVPNLRCTTGASFIWQAGNYLQQDSQNPILGTVPKHISGFRGARLFL